MQEAAGGSKRKQEAEEALGGSRRQQEAAGGTRRQQEAAGGTRRQQAATRDSRFILVPILLYFGCLFGPFLIHLGSILVNFWLPGEGLFLKRFWVSFWVEN